MSELAPNLGTILTRHSQLATRCCQLETRRQRNPGVRRPPKFAPAVPPFTPSLARADAKIFVATERSASDSMDALESGCNMRPEVRIESGEETVEDLYA